MTEKEKIDYEIEAKSKHFEKEMLEWCFACVMAVFWFIGIILFIAFIKSLL
jgi:hypothetical protein